MPGGVSVAQTKMADGIKQKPHEVRRLFLPFHADDWLILIFIYDMVGCCSAGVSDKCGGRRDSGALRPPRTLAAWGTAARDDGNAATPPRGGGVSRGRVVNAGHAASSSCCSLCLRDCGGEWSTLLPRYTRPHAPLTPTAPGSHVNLPSAFLADDASRAAPQCGSLDIVWR